MLTIGLHSKPKLSYAIFCQLREIIYARSGISFADTKIYLMESRILKRLEERNLRTFDEYYYFITYDPDRDKEMTNLLNSIVTNETSFFRDPVQLEGFTKGVIPRVVEAKLARGNKTIKVWSAACSTGEEPYTLAMMLVDEGLTMKGWTIDITGSDISDNVLRSAHNATYDKYSLRNTPEQYVRKYFTNSGDYFVLRKHIADIVKYKKINLIDPAETRQLRDMDAIFCRNVLIYFDDASKKKAIGHLYDSLAKGGYLIMGFSESLHNITRLFKPVNIARSLVYQKL